MCLGSCHLKLVLQHFIANFMKIPKVSGLKMTSSVTNYVKYDVLCIDMVYSCIYRCCIM